MIKLPENKTFTVYEDKWVHGGNLKINKDGELRENSKSALLNTEGNSCCVGHFLRDCGVNLNDVRNIGFASADKCYYIGVPVDWPSAITENNIYNINDDKSLTLEERKSKLKKAFKKAFDITLVFKPTSPKE